MNKRFALNGISVGLSEDKERIKVDLYSAETDIDNQESPDPYCSFVIPSSSYNTLIAAFLKAGKSMEEAGAKLYLSETELGEEDEQNK